MNILAIGGAGYIGSHVVRKLMSGGHSVVVIDDLSTGFAEALSFQVKFIRGDVLNDELLKRTIREHKINAIVHFAAKSIVSESCLQPLNYYEQNVAGVLSLLKACVATGVKKIIFSSTAAVYGNSHLSRNSNNLLTETCSTGPLDPYARSKLMGEQIIRDSDFAYGLKSICLRYFNVAGAALNLENGPRTKKSTHLIKGACEAALGIRTSIEIFGTDYPTQDGTGVRDFIHIEDLCELHLLALRYLEFGGESQIFNCGYGKGFSVLKVIEVIQKLSGNPFFVELKPRRNGDAATLVANSAKAQEMLGWIPKYNDLEFICQSAYDWEKKTLGILETQLNEIS